MIEWTKKAGPYFKNLYCAENDKLSFRGRFSFLEVEWPRLIINKCTGTNCYSRKKIDDELSKNDYNFAMVLQ